MDTDEFNGKMVNEYFQVHNCIGSGSYACTYKGTEVHIGKEVAIKIESNYLQQEEGFAGVHQEAQVYRELREAGYGSLDGFPEFYYLGTFERDFTALVMQRLEQDLDAFLKERGGTLSIVTVIELGVQMLSLLETVHAIEYLHRDVKPSNFMFGVNSRQLYLIDFGLSKRYWDPETDKHIPETESEGSIGSPLFVSLEVLHGTEPSRRDDLISLVLCMVYLFKGELPWEKNDKGEAYEPEDIDMINKKVDVMSNPALLCQGMPPQIEQFYDIISDMEYEDTPDYHKLRNLLREGDAQGI